MGDVVKINQSKLFRLAAAVLLGGAPVWMVVLIWDFTEQRPGWSMFVRFNSLVIPLVEFVFVLIAMAVGFSPLRVIAELPRLTKIAVVIWLMIVSFTSFQPDDDHLSAAMALMKLFFAGLLLLAMVDLRQRSQDDLFTAIWVGTGCTLVGFIALWMLHIRITQPVGDEWVIHVPAVANVRHIGHFAFAGFCAGAVSFISFRDDSRFFWRWSIPVFFSALGLAVALWTGSRGPTLASLSAMGAMFLIGSGFRRQLGMFFAASSLIATIVVAPLPVPHPIYGISGAIGAADLEANADHDASSGRAIIWRETIDKIQQKPFFGWGLEQFATAGPKRTLGMLHPHNFPLQLLFSGGAVAILFSVVIVFPALRNWRWPDRSGIGLAGIGCVAGLVAYSMYDGAFFFSYPIMLLILAIATSISSPASKPAIDKLN